MSSEAAAAGPGPRPSCSQLPVPDIQPPSLTTFDAKDPDTAYPPIEPLLPPEGAPNVLVVLLDDVGFGASSAFGGPIHTPTAERLRSADETCDIGFDSASPVCPDYRTGALRGEVNWVEFDVGEAADDADHVIDPSERLRIALALQ